LPEKRDNTVSSRLVKGERGPRSSKWGRKRTGSKRGKNRSGDKKGGNETRIWAKESEKKESICSFLKNEEVKRRESGLLQGEEGAIRERIGLTV